jgi:hypothetical protein
MAPNARMDRCSRQKWVRKLATLGNRMRQCDGLKAARRKTVSFNPWVVHINRCDSYNYHGEPLAEALGSHDVLPKANVRYLGLPLAVAGITDPSALCAML